MSARITLHTRLAMAILLTFIMGAGARAQCWDINEAISEIGPAGVSDIEAFTEFGETAYYVCGTFSFLNPASRGVVRLRSTTEGWDWENASPVPGSTTLPIRSLQTFDDGSGSALFAAHHSGTTVYRYHDGTWTVFSSDVQVDDFAVHDDGSGPALYAAGIGPAGVDLFRLVNGNWLPLTPIRSPAATDFSFAYDPIRDTLVRFGGQSAPGTLLAPDTWIWTRSTGWSKLSVPGPSARTGAAMIWDPAASRIALIGGQDASGPLADHWEWNGSAWSLRANPIAPAPRAFASCAFDPLRSRLVLSGGIGLGNITRSDIWEWNGLSWAQITPIASGGVHSRAWLTFDPLRGKCVQMTNRTWTWDGASWDELASSVSGNSRHLYFDTANNQLRAAISTSFGALELYRFQPYNWLQMQPRDISPPNLDPARTAFNSTSQTLFVSGANGELHEHTAAGWVAHQRPNLQRLNPIKLFSVHHSQGPALYASNLKVLPTSNAMITAWIAGAFQQFDLQNIFSSDVVACAEGPPGQQTLTAVQSLNAAWRFNPATGFEALPLPGAAPAGLLYADLGAGPHLIGLFSSHLRTLTDGSWSILHGPNELLAHSKAAVASTASGPQILLGDSNRQFMILARTCTPVEITQQPESALSSLQTLATVLVVQATGSPNITYAWRRNGVPVIDGPRFSGSSTNRLSITAPIPSDAGNYDCVVSNPVSSVTSAVAIFSVRSVSPPAGPFTLEVLAITPSEVDGPNNFDTLSWLLPPQLGRDGTLAHQAQLSSDSQTVAAVFQEGAAQPILTEGTQIPSLPGFLTRVSLITPLEAGGVLAQVARTFTYTNSLITKRGDIVTPIVTAGDPLPSPGYTAHNQGFTDCLVDSDGTVYSKFRVTHSSGASANAAYRWRLDEGLTEFIPPNLSIESVPVDSVQRMRRGQDDDRTLLHGYSAGSQGFVAWRSETPAPWQFIARAGQLIGPSLPGHSFGSLNDCFLNDAGAAAFESSNPNYVFSWDPESGVQFRFGAGFNRGLPSEVEVRSALVQGYNRSDEMLVVASIRGAESPAELYTGLFLYSGATLRPVFDGSMPQPAWLESQNGRLVQAIPAYGLSDSGEVLLHINVFMDGRNENGVFAWTPGAGLFPIVVPGMHFVLPDGSTRHVLSAVFSDERTRNTSGLGNNHEFALRIVFTNLTAAIVKGTIIPTLPDWRNCPTVLHGIPSISLREGEPLSLERLAAGAQPLTLQWTLNGIAVQDGQAACGGLVSGSSTTSLNKSHVCRSDAGTYVLAASNACGQQSSDSISVRVICTADIDADDDSDSDDIVAFFDYWEAGELQADVDFDGDTDSDDIITFFNSWDSGC